MVIKVTNKNLAEVRLDSLVSIIRKRSVVQWSRDTRDFTEILTVNMHSPSAEIIRESL